MDNEVTQKRFESVYSTKVRAGKRRTYFFDVRRTKGDDFYITLTESTKKFNGDGYERHKIFLYKEDFNRFLDSLSEVIDHVKSDLMPDYDYDEFTRRQEEWEQRQSTNEQGSSNHSPEAAQIASEKTDDDQSVESSDESIEANEVNSDIPEPLPIEEADNQIAEETDEEDMSW